MAIKRFVLVSLRSEHQGRLYSTGVHWWPLVGGPRMLRIGPYCGCHGYHNTGRT